ncbi:DUF1631 family protein, partial [Ideonella sp.]|uniref:DUF1631 family protein n=1 Tax=Ideonella sp. TaxID=1929293 RepID=UPI003BB4E1C1
AIGQLLDSAGAQGAQPVSAAGSTGAAAAAGSTVEAVSGQLGQLLQVLARQSQAGPVMEPIWARVQACFDRLGADELRALQQPDHPFWRLLDRIAALSVVQQPSSRQMQDLAQQLEPVLGQLEQAAEPLSTMRFDSALAELDSLPMPMEDVNPRGLATALELESRRRDIEPAVRSQLVAQLRPLAVPPTLRQFLLGPWVQVLTAALALDGPENAATERWMNAVADFLGAASRLRRGNAVARPECEALVALAGEGMRGAGLPEHLVQGNLADLSRWLNAGPLLPAATPAEATLYVPPEPEQAAAAQPVAAVPEPDPPAGAPADWDEEWQGHADLDTVPMGMGEALVNDPAAQAEREAWLSALHVGDLCRLKLQGRWVTALLTWRSDNGQFFMFKSRHAAGVHTLSRRSLERLRGEGLATRVEPGQLLAHALSALSLSTG